MKHWNLVSSDPSIEVESPWFTYRRNRSIASYVSPSRLPDKRERRTSNWLNHVGTYTRGAKICKACGYVRRCKGKQIKSHFYFL